jgi:hypothetical protein
MLLLASFLEREVNVSIDPLFCFATGGNRSYQNPWLSGAMQLLASFFRKGGRLENRPPFLFCSGRKQELSRLVVERCDVVGCQLFKREVN